MAQVLKRWRREIVALLALLLVFYAGSQMMMSIVPGYEGVKFYWRGIKYNGQLWTDNMPPPQGASVWNFGADNLNLDYDDAYNGVQNLLVEAQTNGQLEKDTWGNTLSKTVSWDVLVRETSTEKVTKKIQAEVYYFIIDTSFSTRVDEGVGAPFFNTERYTPWKDFVLYAEVDAYNWNKFEGNLTDENFACLLGVEVVNWEYTAQGDKFHFEPNFQGGQSLTMYTSIDGSPIVPMLPEQAYGRDIMPDPNARSTAFIKLPFGKLGVEAAWNEGFQSGVVHVKLRVHVLKVNKWICVQTYGGTYTPPPYPTNPSPWWGNFSEWFKFGYDIFFKPLTSLMVTGIIIVCAVAAIVIILASREESGGLR
jgi:hypothetical protein